MKSLTVNKPDNRLAAEFKQKCDLSLSVLRLLTARGFCDFQQVVDFFSAEELEDPFIIAGMQQAADTINEYIDSYKLICVYGDYDCDGVTATALLYNYLESMGANVMYYINEREEGYGMTVDAVRSLNEQGVELIVTVDNGVSCLSEAEEIANLGMKLVITDHHQPPEILPKAEAVVDPHRADCPSVFKDLAGVGVALKLCAALDGGSYDVVLEQYADICSIGTVGDLVPLRGENRTIVRKGLMYLKNSENFGLNELIDRSGANREKLSSGTLAFSLCPRINAAGRFASPIIALKTLLTEDDGEASDLVGQLMTLNEQRKQTEAEIFSQIMQLIDSDPSILEQRVLVLAGKSWHHGVIGIVSSRVLETYGKPNIILSIDENGVARGSARSFKGFNIHSCFTYASDCLEKFGGHECAGGLTVKEENISAFNERVQEYAAKMRQMPLPVTECDMVIDESELTVENIRSFEVLEPFGIGNPQPTFLLPSCRVNAVYPLSGGKHTKLDVTYGSKRLAVLIFSKSPQELFVSVNCVVDIAAHIDINEYNGKESLSLKAVDIIPHGMQIDKYLAAKDCYEKFRSGASMPINFIKKMTPTRQELVYVYKLLTAYNEMDADTLFLKINLPAVNYCKLRLMIDVFCEAGLAKFIPSRQRVTLIPVREKADLEKTATMKRLYSLING
ncbi:MAG: single-stranded-DNA-specific exonuclease RecJ [Oscillospiraceae bacterium]